MPDRGSDYRDHVAYTQFEILSGGIMCLPEKSSTAFKVADKIEAKPEQKLELSSPDYRSPLIAHHLSGRRQGRGGIIIRSNFKKLVVNIRAPKWKDTTFWIGVETYEIAQYVADAVFYYIGRTPFHFRDGEFRYPPLSLGTGELLTTREQCSAYVGKIAKGHALRQERKDYVKRVVELALEAVKGPEVALFLRSLRSKPWLVPLLDPPAADYGKLEAANSKEETLSAVAGDGGEEHGTPKEVETLSEEAILPLVAAAPVDSVSVAGSETSFEMDFDESENILHSEGRGCHQPEGESLDMPADNLISTVGKFANNRIEGSLQSPNPGQIMHQILIGNFITVKHYRWIVKSLRDNLLQAAPHKIPPGEGYERILKRLAGRLMTSPNQQDFEAALYLRPLGYAECFDKLLKDMEDLKWELEYLMTLHHRCPEQECMIVNLQELTRSDLRVLESRIRIRQSADVPRFNVVVESLLQIAWGMNLLHSRGLMHRDYKSLYTLTQHTEDIVSKIVDVGSVSRYESRSKTNLSYNKSGMRYESFWRAPEIRLMKAAHKPKVAMVRHLDKQLCEEWRESGGDLKADVSAVTNAECGKEAILEDSVSLGSIHQDGTNEHRSQADSEVEVSMVDTKLKGKAAQIIEDEAQPSKAFFPINVNSSTPSDDELPWATIGFRHGRIAEGMRALLESTEEAPRLEAGPEWIYVSEHLWEKYGFDRASASCQTQWGTLLRSNQGHFGSADCDELDNPGSDSETEENDKQSEDDGLSGESAASLESQAEVTTADSHVPQTEPSKYAGRKRSAVRAFGEDDLLARIAPFVTKQIEGALQPLISALRSREEDEQKHREKMLAVEEEKLALMRQKLEFTRRVLAHSHAFIAHPRPELGKRSL